MGLLSRADPVESARKAVQDAEAAVVAEGKRLEAAIAAADSFARDAASVDPDDPGAFGRATSRLAELRSKVEILRAREAAAKVKAEEAREAFTAADLADKRGRLERLDADVRAREERAIARVRTAVREFDAELRALAALGEEGAALALDIEPGRATWGPRYGGSIAFAGRPLAALQDLANAGRL